MSVGLHTKRSSGAVFRSAAATERLIVNNPIFGTYKHVERAAAPVKLDLLVSYRTLASRSRARADEVRRLRQRSGIDYGRVRFRPIAGQHRAIGWGIGKASTRGRCERDQELDFTRRE